MAVRALPPGTARRRAAFGLLDADGWTWAGIKALFWFLLIIFLLGYVPDRAYYMTVLRTIDFGYNVVSPINLCPPENRTLPCPAPAGSVVPWQPNSAELTLPAGRSGAGVFASGENFYIVGGETAEGATASVLATVVDEDGNPGEWQEAAALPEPRADAAVINLAGIPYVIGGRDGGGNATDTVFVGTLEEGQLTGWETSDELVLPEPRYDAAGAATATSIWVIGGRNADGEVVSATYRSMLSEAAVPVLEPWQVVIELPLPEPRAAATAASVGTDLYVLGGETAEGRSDTVFYLPLDTHGDPEMNPQTERAYGWGVSVGPAAAAALPEPRSHHTTFVNSGAVYVLGGIGPAGSATATNFWTVPDSATGGIDGWTRLDATDLPEPRADASAVVVGAHAFVVGGESDAGPLDSSLRAETAPGLPFFRLGLFGLTIPALGIPGDIGQELGLLAAGTVGMGNLFLLIIIGWMYSHPRHTQRFFAWVSRGRVRVPPPEDDYRA